MCRYMRMQQIGNQPVMHASHLTMALAFTVVQGNERIQITAQVPHHGQVFTAQLSRACCSAVPCTCM